MTDLRVTEMQKVISHQHVTGQIEQTKVAQIKPKKVKFHVENVA
jgi:hypothetical protein